MRARPRFFMAATVVAVLTLTACGSGDNGTGNTESAKSDSGSKILIGTTDKVTSLDPAGSNDTGSSAVQSQVFRYVMGFEPGNPIPVPDVAESCSFTDPKTYECKIKSGQKFANGNPLDANAVKFTFDRILTIKDVNGPISYLANLGSTDAPDANTVRFNLKLANDQTFSKVIGSSAGPIVDPKVFSADKLTKDEDIVAGKAFAGPYAITTYKTNEMIEFTPNADYDSIQGKPKNSGVILKFYTDATNMRLDVAKGTIDVVASPTMTPTDIEGLKTTDGVKVYTKAGGSIRFLVFNLNTMPGATEDQKLAIRKAVASLIDREKICDQVYKGTFAPLWSFVPEGIPGANMALKDTYGAKPDVAKAKKFLDDAGVKTPVDLPIQYNTDHYGAASADEYNEIKNELESSKLFNVDLQTTEWGTYIDVRAKDAYPLYQLGWTQAYPDADYYLTPNYGPDNGTVNHFDNPQINALLDEQRSTVDETKRNEILATIQNDLATKYLPVLPLLTGSKNIVARDNVTGIETTLDESMILRYAVIAKK